MLEVSSHKQPAPVRSLRNQVIAEYLPYVKRIVQRIAVHLPPNVELDDLLHAGVIGLIEAIEGFDPGRDNKFLTYAVFRIRGAVLSELRAQDFLSRANRKKIREMERTHGRLEQQLGREAKDEEVADALGLELNEFYQVKTMSTISFVSIEGMGSTVKESREKLLNFLADGKAENGLSLSRLKEVEIALGRAIDQLGEKERQVISLYYWDELTMKEIGKVLDITESRVSQIHSQALMHLRGKLRKEGIID